MTSPRSSRARTQLALTVHCCTAALGSCDIAGPYPENSRPITGAAPHLFLGDCQRRLPHILPEPVGAPGVVQGLGQGQVVLPQHIAPVLRHMDLRWLVPGQGAGPADGPALGMCQGGMWGPYRLVLDLFGDMAAVTLILSSFLWQNHRQQCSTSGTRYPCLACQVPMMGAGKPHLWFIHLRTFRKPLHHQPHHPWFQRAGPGDVLKGHPYRLISLARLRLQCLSTTRTWSLPYCPSQGWAVLT